MHIWESAVIYLILIGRHQATWTPTAYGPNYGLVYYTVEGSSNVSVSIGGDRGISREYESSHTFR